MMLLDYVTANLFSLEIFHVYSIKNNLLFVSLFVLVLTFTVMSVDNGLLRTSIMYTVPLRSSTS